MRSYSVCCRFVVVSFLAVVLAVLLVPVSLNAQSSSTATVTGTVTDQKGAAVPNAAVELRNVATGDARHQLSVFKILPSQRLTLAP